MSEAKPDTFVDGGGSGQLTLSGAARRARVALTNGASAQA